jgi:hypothetical protein
MKSAADQTTADSASEKANLTTAKFTGTDNPRHLRGIAALRRRPMPREHLDAAMGASNGPDAVAELRRRGLEIPCERVPDIDRDGRPIKRGVYSLTTADRRKVNQWLAGRK